MLTKRQKQILDFVTNFIGKNDYSPSLEEIKRHFRLRSVATVHEHIETLQSKEYLSKEEHQPRSLSISKEEKNTKIPLLGLIAAGEPIEAIQEYETISIPKHLLTNSGEHFALRVKGNSMIQEGIFDGDNVIIRKQNSAEDGDTIVALKLQPSNPSIEAFVVKQLIVQGKVVSVMRSYVGRKTLDQTLNLLTFNNELKQFIIKAQEEIKHKFKPNNEFEIWQRTENKPDQDKFCLETGYTFLNEILLLWVCKDKKLLSFEVINNRQQLISLKQEAQQIYSHIFESNIFDWYEPSDFLLQEITNSFNKYDFTPIDRDILGKLYEQFITREERKKLGQSFLKLFFKKMRLGIIFILDYNSSNP